MCSGAAASQAHTDSLTLLRCLQIKCRHFQAADMRKFQAVWAMKQQEAQELAQQVMQVGSSWCSGAAGGDDMSSC